MFKQLGEARARGREGGLVPHPGERLFGSAGISFPVVEDC